MTDDQRSLDNASGLRGKRALVVGGGFGIGREVARILAAHGTAIAVADLDGERADEVAGELAEHGADAVALVGDVCAVGEARRIVNEAAETLGELDILVNVVGKSTSGRLLDLPDGAIAGAMQLNYIQQAELAIHFARRRVAAGGPGSVTMVSSLAGVVPFPDVAPYGAAKAAMNSVVRSMALEWGNAGIRVNAVAPGMTLTDRNNWSDEVRARFAAAIPLEHRIGTQTQIANAVVVVASDLMGYLTGQTIVVDGGASMYTQAW